MIADETLAKRDTSRIRTLRAAERKRRQRDNEREMGMRTITIRLDPDEAELFARLRHKQRGSLDDFPRRALITGAMFAANSGTPKGQKEKRRSAPCH